MNMRKKKQRLISWDLDWVSSVSSQVESMNKFSNGLKRNGYEGTS